MALPASGAISLNDVNVELGSTATSSITMNDTTVRTLFSQASGIVDMNTGHGKSYGYKVIATYYNSKDILVTNDGITWSRIINALPLAAYSMTYCNGNFVAAGTTNVISYSNSNGMSWNSVTGVHTINVGGFPSISTDGVSTIMVVYSSVPGSIPAPALSYDKGLTWSKYVPTITGNFTGDGLSGYGRGSGTGAGAGNWIIVPTVPTKPTAYSHFNNATSFATGGAIPSTMGTYNSLCSIASGAAGTFVVVGSSNNVLVALTTDYGQTWSTPTTPAVSGFWCSVTYGNGIYVMTGTGVTAAYSTNGSTWSSFTMPIEIFNGWQVTWSPTLNRFVAVGSIASNTYTAYSPIGWTGSNITWTQGNTVTSVNVIGSNCLASK